MVEREVYLFDLLDELVPIVVDRGETEGFKLVVEPDEKEVQQVMIDEGVEVEDRAIITVL